MHSFRSSDDLRDPRANALLNTSFEGVPQSLFILSELDPLRDGNLGMKCYSSLDRPLLLSFRVHQTTRKSRCSNESTAHERSHSWILFPARYDRRVTLFLLLIISAIKFLGIFPEACAEAIVAIQAFMSSV